MTTQTLPLNAPSVAAPREPSVESERALRRAGLLVAGAGGSMMLALLGAGAWLALVGPTRASVRINFGLEAWVFAVGVAAVTRHDLARRHIGKVVWLLHLGFLLAAVGLYFLITGVPDGMLGMVIAQTVAGTAVGSAGVAARRALDRVNLEQYAWDAGWPPLAIAVVSAYALMVLGIMASFIGRAFP